MQREWPSGFKAEPFIILSCPKLDAYKMIMGYNLIKSQSSTFFYEEIKQ